MKDGEIVELFLERSERALGELQTKYGRYLFSISKGLLGNEQDAEECVNETLAASWRSIPPQRPDNLKAYAGKLCREISISRFRSLHAKKRAQSEYAMSLEEIADVIGDDGEPATEVETEALSRALSEFLRTIPEVERNMMIRRYWYNDSIKSICERFSFGESKVKVTLKRTRDKLAKYLKKEGFLI